jgi:NAD(P)-dependent dehydrogenase (short-subunit alcohol dehydrogenase family)
MAVSTSSKIVLVTGANQGIGFEIAKSLSSKPGYHVLLGSRDPQRGIDAAKKLQEQKLDIEPITIEYVAMYCLIISLLKKRWIDYVEEIKQR